MPTLASLHIYPLKSCAPLPQVSAHVHARGLAHDRRWMVIDAHGKFLTARQRPRMTLIRASLRGLDADDDALRLDASGMPDIDLDPPASGAARVVTAVWGTPVTPLLADAPAHEWISTFLGQPCRIVYMDAACTRTVDPDYASVGDEVSFADGYPMLLISQAALDQLNDKLTAPISMLRFRPNLVVAGTEPHAEDGWKRIRIGAIEFDLVKTCTRCVFTTVDFTRGEFAPDGEPLRTLKTYRRTPAGITFGQNLIPRGDGILRVGDAVQVIA